MNFRIQTYSNVVSRVCNKNLWLKNEFINRRFSTSPSSSSNPPNVANSSAKAQSPRIKHKPPKKRASFLLNELKNEEFLKLKKERNWPEINAGDSISIEKLPFITSPTTDIMKGVVISKTNRFSDTAVTILNCEQGTPLIRRIIIYNPLIRNIKILQKAYIHEGKKRVRRSKIYYLLKRDPEEYTIT